MKLKMLVLFVIVGGWLAGCSVKPPSDVPVVTNFDVSRYLGTWYEIARLDHSFERNMQQVTANYSLRDDNGINVLNRGYDEKKQKWKESDGKAYFVSSPTTAALKVSFFGPFYGGYNIIVLDSDYRYALVCGPNKQYLWILSRTPTLDQETTQRLVETARQYGFDTDALIWVKQTPSS